MKRAKQRAQLRHLSSQIEEAEKTPIDLNGPQPPLVTDIDMAFPCRYRELLPKWEDLTEDEQAMHGPFCNALSGLFFKGGKLADHGIAVRDGIDKDKVMRYIRATLGDFGPKHEHKIGGIAHMLAKWCDTIPKAKS